MDTGVSNGIYTMHDQGLFNGVKYGIESGIINGSFNELFINYNIIRNGLIFYIDTSYNKLFTNKAILSDLSGYGNIGVLRNNPRFDISNKKTLIFNGVNNYIEFNDSNLLPTAGLTVSCFFKTTVADRWLIDKSAGGIANGYYLIGSSSSKMQFGINASAVVSPGNITTGGWIQATGTWSPSSSIVLYINGSSVASTSTAIPASINNPSSYLQICRRATLVDYWNGYFANALIYNRALSSTEILQNYNTMKNTFGL